MKKTTVSITIDVDKRLASIDTKLAVLTAMVGAVIGLVLLVLWKVS